VDVSEGHVLNRKMSKSRIAKLLTLRVEMKLDFEAGKIGENGGSDRKFKTQCTVQ
jgi:hypothetical protein